MLAIVHGLIAAVKIGLKENDKLALARVMMRRKLEGQQTSSKRPKPFEIAISRPPVLPACN
ncbi:hypothetical protein [Brucella sp. NBRC 14130]|uniref:hypothetical protein n=1 Tax=Brucella sp. NBRC 14130 TaxID=3075483 RepID=UPI003340DAA8